MNKTRRKQLQTILQNLETLQHAVEVHQADEEHAAENIPDSMESKKQAAESFAERLTDAGDAIGEAILAIQDVLEGNI